MKVFFINAVCGRGSTGRIVTDIMKMLNDSGHQCRAAYSQEPIASIDAAQTVRIGSKLDYYIHNVLSRLTDHEGGYSRRATRKLIEEIRKFDPDVIHLHNLHGHWIHYQSLFEFLAVFNKPVVWTLHDCWAFTGHCVHFSYVKCDKWMEGCYDCPQLHTYPHAWKYDRSKKNYEDKKRAFTSVGDMTIVTPSEWLAALVRKSYLGKYPVRVIYNGIDMSVFRPMGSGDRKSFGQ